METREVVVAGTPRSLQATRRGLEAWKRVVTQAAAEQIAEHEGSIQFVDVAVTLLHLCPEWGDNDGDLDNIAKPILDALCDSGRVLFNDNQVKELYLKRIEWRRHGLTRLDGASEVLTRHLDLALQQQGPEQFIYIFVTTELSLEKLP